MEKTGDRIFPILVVLAIIVVFFFSILIGKLSLLFFSLILFITGNFLLKEKKAKNIYSIFFIVYAIFSFSINFIIIKDPLIDFFVNNDGIKYFSNSKYLSSFDRVLSTCITYYPVHEYIFYGWILGLAAKAANYIDVNNIYIHLSFLIFLASLIPAIIYKALILLGIKRTKSYNLSLLYGFLSFNLMYACIFQRDMLINLLYILFIYCFIKPFSIKNVVFLLVIIFFTFFTRIENGIFLLLPLAVYIASIKVSNKTKILVI